MKTAQPSVVCTLQSVTYTPERRVMTFSRNAPQPEAARTPVKRRKSAPFRLHLLITPEAECSFEPAIRVRSQTKS